MVITIPTKILIDNNLNENTLLLNFACYLYAEQLATMGQARHIANVDQITFQKALKERGIYLHISEDDFEKDLKNLGLTK